MANTAAVFSMANTTYGRSKTGKSKLKDNFSQDIEKIKKALNQDAYTKFKNIINQNWQGADKDAFLESVEKQRKNLNSSLDALKTQFSNALDDDYKQFSNQQNTNKNSI